MKRLLTRRLLALTAVASLTLVGCGDDENDDTPDGDTDVGMTDSGESDAGGSDVGGDTGASDTSEDAGSADVDADADETEDVGPADDTPPRLRSVRIVIDGEYSTEVDLDAARSVTLPLAQQAELVVFASDETSDVENLTVALVDTRTETPIEVTGGVDSGLWKLDFTIDAGVTLRVDVTDEAGNVSQSEGTLDLPTPAEAILGEWELRTYDTESTIIARGGEMWNDDGTWSRELRDGSGTSSGTFAFTEAGTVEIVQDVDAGVPMDPATRVEATPWVDDIYRVTSVFEQTGEGDGTLGGVWERTWVEGPVDGSADVTVRQMLTLADDGTYVDERFEGGESVQRVTGDWNLVENEDYADAFGDFLLRTPVTRDGEDVEGAEPFVDLVRIRAGRLLLDPALRVEGT